MHTKQTGVTLVELMIVVAVVAILGAIAYPSYQNQTRKSRRSEAKAALLQIQVAQEKWFLQHNVYTNSLASLNSASPTTHGYYTIDVAVGNPATTYTATATKAGGQTADTHCATFTVNQAGLRDATNADCW